MVGQIPATALELQAFKQCFAILSNRVSRAIKFRSVYDALQQQVNRTQDQKQVFHCKHCPRVFTKVHQRSAHMNKHRNEKKRQEQPRLKPQKNKMKQKKKAIKRTARPPQPDLHTKNEISEGPNIEDDLMNVLID